MHKLILVSSLILILELSHNQPINNLPHELNHEFKHEWPIMSIIFLSKKYENIFLKPKKIETWIRNIKLEYSHRFLKIFPLTVPTDTKENQVVWGMVWVK